MVKLKDTKTHRLIDRQTDTHTHIMALQTLHEADHTDQL